MSTTSASKEGEQPSSEQVEILRSLIWLALAVKARAGKSLGKVTTDAESSAVIFGSSI